MSIPKAYENSEFLHSTQAREVRILAEFSEPRYRLKRHGVDGTIVFFGSARTLSVADAAANLARVEASNPSPAQLRKAKGLVKVAPYYDAARFYPADFFRAAPMRHASETAAAVAVARANMERAGVLAPLPAGAFEPASTLEL